MPCWIGALLPFIKASLAGHPFDDGIVNEGLPGNPWFSHELEDRRDRFRLDAGDAVEIGYRVTVMLLDTLGSAWREYLAITLSALSFWLCKASTPAA